MLSTSSSVKANTDTAATVCRMLEETSIPAECSITSAVIPIVFATMAHPNVLPNSNNAGWMGYRSATTPMAAKLNSTNRE